MEGIPRQARGSTGPPAGYFVIRFEYNRSPGVRASGIGVVPKESVGDWTKAFFFTVSFHPELETRVRGFALDYKTPAEQQVILDALNNVQYLVFQGGERAMVADQDMERFQIILKGCKPIWDEYALAKKILESSIYHDALRTSNTFGAWADVVLGRLSAETGSTALGWKMVGRNPRLMPTVDRKLRFQHGIRQDSRNACDFFFDSGPMVDIS